MNSKSWKNLRLGISLTLFAGLTAALTIGPHFVLPRLGHWFSSLQFIPALLALTMGTGLSLVALLILVVTLSAGRIYCSTICPLGALQDAVARLRTLLRRKPRPYTYARPVTRIRSLFFLATILGVVAGWGGLVLALVDPYSNFARIVSGLFRPLLRLSGSEWASLGVIAFPLLFLVLIVALAAWRGRLYCNTVCPVGTLLGFLSARAVFRLHLDKSACRQCMACVRVCKAQCVEPESGTIDAARCVACFNCIGACPNQLIGYRLSWGQKKQLAEKRGKCLVPVDRLAMGGTTDPSRRALLAGATLTAAGALGVRLAFASENAQQQNAPIEGTAQGLQKPPRPIRPPGSGTLEAFLDRCTGCQLCVSACPKQVLQPASFEYGLSGWMKPQMDFSRSYCDYDCVQCTEVCPGSALQTLPLAEKHLTRVGLAQLNPAKCIVQTKQTTCTRCIDSCPTKAIETVPFGPMLRLPQVKALLCIGCGRCEYECPVQPQKAIVVSGLLRETHVRKLPQKTAI